MSIERRKKCLLVYRVTATAYTAMLLIGNIALGTSASAVQNNDRQNDALANVRTSPDLPVAIDNSENPPLLIQKANVKEINRRDYEQLTRAASASDSYVRCPNIELANTTDKTLTSSALGFFNRTSGELQVLIAKRRIEPFQKFLVEPADWASIRKGNLKKFVLKDGVALEDKSLPDLDSEAMWFSGRVNDFYVLVLEVSFEDGSKWTTKR